MLLKSIELKGIVVDGRIQVQKNLKKTKKKLRRTTVLSMDEYLPRRDCRNLCIIYNIGCMQGSGHITSSYDFDHELTRKFIVRLYTHTPSLSNGPIRRMSRVIHVHCSSF